MDLALSVAASLASIVNFPLAPIAPAESASILKLLSGGLGTLKRFCLPWARGSWLALG